MNNVYYVVTDADTAYEAIASGRSRYVGTNRTIAFQSAEDGDFIYHVEIAGREKVSVTKKATVDGSYI